jgi:hypothetical protein
VSWELWFYIACLVAALILAGAGAVRALSALSAVRRRAEEVVPHELIVSLTAAQHDGERLQRALSEMESLPGRAQAAVAQMRASLDALRLPQAVAAIRIAIVAVRLLVAR